MPVVDPLVDIIEDKEVISVYAANAAMTDGEPDVINQAVLYSVLTGGDIAENMLSASMELFSSDVEKYYKYGRDHYIDGLPVVITSAVLDREALEAGLMSALAKERNLQPGQAIVITNFRDSQYHSANCAAAEWLTENTTFDDATMQIPAGGSPQYPTSTLTWAVGWHDPMAEDQGGDAYRDAQGIHTYWNIDHNNDGTFDEMHVPQIIPDKYPAGASTRADGNEGGAGAGDGDEDGDGDYIQPVEGLFYLARYFVVDSGTQEPIHPAYYFIYKVGTGEYPELESGFLPQPEATVYPIVSCRVDHNDYCNPANAGTERYETTKKLLSIIGIDIQQMYEGIMENPDQAEVDHVYTLLGVNFTDTRESSVSYLWYWADYYYKHFGFVESPATAGKVVPLADGNEGGSGAQNGDDSNYVESQDFIMSYQSPTYWEDIHITGMKKKTVARSGFPIGSYTKEYTAQYADQYGDTYGVVLYKQITATEALCYIVYEIVSYVNVYGAKDTWHEMRLNPESTDQLVVVPIQKDILFNMPRLVRNDMLYTTYHTAFHAYHIEYIEWYQDGFLGLVLAIVGIFIPGYSGWDDFMAGILVGGSAGIINFGVYLGKMMLKSLAISVSAIVIGKAFGIEGLVIAAAALWWFTSPGIGAPDWMPDIWEGITSGGPAQGWITGEITKGIVEIKVEEISLEIGEIQAEIDAAQDAAYAMWQEMQPPFRLDPLGLYTAIDMTPYDSPSTYIGRKTATTQLSQMCGYDAIVNFTETQLNLYPV